MNKLEQARLIINEVDSKMIELFKERMNAARMVAEHKMENNLPVLDKAREEALINKRKPGNPLAKYHRKKELTPIEQLEYKVALLERELLKKDGEIVRLKKSIELERGDVKRK